MPSKKRKRRRRRGRPRKEGGSDKLKKKRGSWRKASTKYYEANRRKILAKMRVT